MLWVRQKKGGGSGAGAAGHAVGERRVEHVAGAHTELPVGLALPRDGHDAVLRRTQVIHAQLAELAGRAAAPLLAHEALERLARKLLEVAGAVAGGLRRDLLEAHVLLELHAPQQHAEHLRARLPPWPRH